MTEKFSEARLGLIAAPSARWPAADSAILWRIGHEAVAALVDRARKADVAIAAVEGNSDLSDVGRLKAIGDIALQAVNALDDLPELGRLRAQAERDVRAFEQKIGQAAEAPTDAAEALLHQEIRNHIRSQAEPIDAAYAQRNDPRVVTAIVSAPAMLSGLSEQQKNEFARAARSSLWPDETGKIARFNDAVRVVEEAIKQVQGMVAERGQLLRTIDGWQLPLAAKAA